jgi:uncharacterized protein (TIGR02145 family)
MKKDIRKSIYPIFLLAIAILFISSCKKDDNNPAPSGTVTDADGNIYHTITIGPHLQTWMVENLKVTHLNDGNTIIPNVTDNTTWGGQTIMAYCWYNNDPINKATYGALYNWYAASNPNLCPIGWHVPNDNDWAVLITNLGGDSTSVGGYLKESGTVHWLSPNTGATNISGFTALPGGSHYTNGVFYLNGKYGWYWSTTESSSTSAWHEYMQYNNQAISRTSGNKSLGFSVRCIKDN